MGKINENNRRNFIKKLTGGVLISGTTTNMLLASPAGTPQVLPLSKETTSPNDNIQVACIGTGIMGMGDIKAALKVPGVKLMAVADLYDGRLTRAKELFGSGIQTTRDYSEILKRSDIDAIILATPDHLHSLIAVEALKAGKAVYCEKPMVHKIEQGHEVIKAQKDSKKFFR
ncbi:Gfo/Idh/MocA family protein [Telluribacter sp.]|jgi:predicted dehydrogenase|uniref:Gfo/Idh/MocA family protein n=1 Tax=Telluribacter sp. TaxID=1978767 RepID=UPI002E13D00A|nr:Gfo/Idh/MocA family oxidoreductase [Telluribacter sp.]